MQGPGPAHQPVSTVLGCPAHQPVNTVLGCPAHQSVSTVLGCPAHQSVSTVLGCPAHQPVSTVLGCPAHQPVSTSTGMPCPPACEHSTGMPGPPACEHQYWDASGPAASQVGSQYHSLGGQVGPSTRRPTPALGPLDPVARDPRTQLCLPVGQHSPQHLALLVGAHQLQDPGTWRHPTS